jgi:hypothetical protein
MLLPEDNSLPLPQGNDLCLDRNYQILPTLDDALALLPAWARQLESPVRDALLAAWRAMANALQSAIGQRFARVTSPRSSDGKWLEEWGEIHHRAKVPGELEGAYRARLLEQGDVVSPNAIKAVVDALVAEVSPIAPVYLEPATDAIFWSTPDSPWTAFWQPQSTRLWADYPDNINPTVGAYWAPAIGQYGTETPGFGLFWIVLPGDASAGEPQMYWQPNDGGPAGTQWGNLIYDPSFFMPLGSEVGFVFSSDTPLLERVRSSVEPIHGGGVLWMAFGDPGITTAK